MGYCNMQFAELDGNLRISAVNMCKSAFLVAIRPLFCRLLFSGTNLGELKKTTSPTWWGAQGLLAKLSVQTR